MKLSSMVLHASGAAALVAILTGCSAGSGSSTPAALNPSGAHPDAPIWYRYVYAPSGYTLIKNQAKYSEGTVSITFQPTKYVALLLTKNGAYTGNLTGKTVSATIAVSGTTYPFVYQDGGSCGSPATVRFYFRAPSFEYTNFWWSNPTAYTLANGSATLTVPLTDPSQWSDWNGQSGSSNPTAFAGAVANVNMIGLSFGGGCFFENGATVGGGTGTLGMQFSVM